MKIVTGSALVGTIALVLATAPTQLMAETVKTVNGVDIDSAVLDFYIETRTQKPAAEATAAERDAILNELSDIYLLTSQDRANELAEDPRVKAQAELQYRAMLANATASDYVINNPATDEEIFAEYTAQLELQPAKQYRARHILVPTQEEAIEIIEELDGGADFAELATTRSTGPSGPNGGDLGWFSPEQMVKPFSDAVIELEDSAYTKAPVQTQFGWHVILREGTQDNEPPPLDSVRDTIKQRVEQQKLQTYIEGLRASEAAPE